MPRFFFDLHFDRYVVLDPGGLLLECPSSASAAADTLAQHLRVTRPEVCGHGSCIRVRDQHRKQIYRSPIGPAASASRQQAVPELS